MKELILSIPADWALPAILCTGAALCATACALWRGGFAAGQAEARFDHLLHMEETEAATRDAVAAAERRLEDILRPRHAVRVLGHCTAADLPGQAESLTNFAEPSARR